MTTPDHRSYVDEMSTSRVRIESRESLAYVTLNRPEKHNALDWDMLRGLVDAARDLERDRSIRGVLLCGEGPSFCSGLDFPKFVKEPLKLARAFVKRPGRSTNLFQEACWAWRRLPLPVATAIHGRCYGGGLQIALATDFRFAAPDCEMSILETKWGLIPDMTGSVTLRELMPIDKAKMLTMTGRLFDGNQAAAFNLVTEVSENPRASAEVLLREITTRSPDAVAAAKRLFQQTWVMDEDAAFSAESRLQASILGRANQREALNSNFKKRPPRFRR